MIYHQLKLKELLQLGTEQNVILLNKNIHLHHLEVTIYQQNFHLDFLKQKVLVLDVVERY